MIKNAKYYRDIADTKNNEKNRQRVENMENNINKYKKELEAIKSSILEYSNNGKYEIINVPIYSHDVVKTIKYVFSKEKGYRVYVRPLSGYYAVTIYWGDDE